jgi:hypothetical protein
VPSSLPSGFRVEKEIIDRKVQNEQVVARPMTRHNEMVIAGIIDYSVKNPYSSYRHFFGRAENIGAVLQQ